MHHRLQLWAFIVVCSICWMLNPAAWIADDSYFYLVIARNIAWEGSATFSGIMPTNGFHPLWGWLLGFWAIILDLFSPGWLLTPRFGVPLALLCLLLSVEYYRRLTDVLGLPVLTLVFPIAFTTYFGVLYSEGHLSLLALTALFLQAVNTCRQPVLSRLILLGLVSAMAILARLDNLFVVGFLLLFVLLSTSQKAGILSLLPVSMLLLLVGLYIASNHAWYGGYMPVSGWMKSSFPSISIQGFHGGANPSLAGVPVLWGWGVMAVSAWICTRVSGEPRSLLIVLLSGVTAKNVYIALFTRSHTGWYWYSTVDLFMMGFALSAWLGQQPNRQRYLKFCIYGIAGISAAGMIFKALTWSMPEDSRPARGLSLVLNSTQKGDTILVSDWPGYVAFFAADRNIIAADMLTANRHWYSAMRQNENAIDFIRASCASVGKPLSHVLWNGNRWLVWDPDNRTIDFNDPRTYPVESKIGEIRLDSDPIAVRDDSMLWKL